MRQFVGRIIISILTVSLLAATAVKAQPTPPPLPLRLKNCQSQHIGANGDASFNRCFEYDPKSEYAQVYVYFRMEDFDFDSFARTIDDAQRRSALKRIKSFFLPKTKEGNIFVTFTLFPGGGVAPVPIGEIPLASFSKTDSKGIVIKRAAVTRDGFYGPAFLATAQTQVHAEIRYVFTDDQSSRIASVLTEVSSFFAGLGLLSNKAVLSGRLKDGLNPIDNVIGSQFDRSAELTTPIQLSFDPSSTMAAYRHLTFNGITTNGGHLYVGLAKMRSVLVNPPEDDGPIIYSSKGYDPLVIDDILDRRIDGLTLRSHMRTAMGAHFEKLKETKDIGLFLEGNKALGLAVDDSELNLNPSDKLALRWALLAGNPLLKKKEVRDAYLLSSYEPALAALKLELPPIALELTDQQKLLREAAQAAAESAKGTLDSVNTAIRDGSDAQNAALLPTPAAGYVRFSNASFTYRGEAPTQDKRFNGNFSFANGGQYTGSFMHSLVPIFHGYGRYTGGSAEPDLRDYSGQFANNYFSGSGIMRWKDGREFHGQFANDKPNGYGIRYDADGTSYYVQFVAGEPTGMSIRKRASSQRLEPGRWFNGQFVGDN